MSESEYTQFKDHIEAQIADLNESISQYHSKSYHDRAAAYSQISRTFDQISRDLSEWQATAETWPASWRSQVSVYLRQVRANLSAIQQQFTSQVAEANRQQLLGNPSTQTIERDRLADGLLDGANQAKDAGIGILDELGRQRTKLGHIAGNAHQLNADLDRGESLLNEMQCRSRQRKYFLVGVILFLFITLGVFIYYILN
jgi:hypothetical protein